MSETLIREIIEGLLVPILPILTAYIISLLRKKTADIEENTKLTSYSKYINILENAVETAVDAVSQTVVDTAKKNGNFDSNAQAEALNLAKSKVGAIVSNNAKNAITEAHSDFDAYVNDKIEAYIKNNSNGSSSVASTIISNNVGTLKNVVSDIGNQVVEKANEEVDKVLPISDNSSGNPEVISDVLKQE